MTWPTSQIAESSTAQIWGRMCGDAANCKNFALGLVAQANAGQLTPRQLRVTIPAFKSCRAYLAANDGQAGLQSYARLVSGDATFDLASESAALKSAYAGVIQEGRALHNASVGSLAADGTTIEPLEVIPPANAAAFVAACAAFAAAVS